MGEVCPEMEVCLVQTAKFLRKGASGMDVSHAGTDTFLDKDVGFDI